jgi:hypothetical protein
MSEKKLQYCLWLVVWPMDKPAPGATLQTQ